jgi:hypothetical protein
MNSLQWIIKIVVCLLLVSCKQSDVTYQYLMQHPSELQEKYKACEDSASQDKACEIVRTAAKDFLELVNERNQDPEAFGQKVLQIQMKLATLEQDSKDYQDEKQQFQILYAVIAATTSTGDQ